MWPIIAFLAVVTLVLANFFWQEWRLRKEREKAHQEYIAAALKAQQAAYAQALAQQEVLFNSMAEGVLLLDATGCVQLINESLRRLLNLASDIRGRTVTETLRSPELLVLWERLQHDGNVREFEFELPAHNRFVQVNGAFVFDKNLARQGAIFVFHDLTRMRQLENTRKEFVANVSHELRTPLSLIKGFSETLLDGAKDNSEVATRFLHNIDKHADRLLYLIEDLLAISRLESGQVALNQQPVRLHEIVKRVFADLQKPATEKEISLQNNIPQNSCAWADGDRLQQVLVNLVENAIKYGRQKGHVVLSAREIKDGKVEIAVQDDGPGIPAEAQERIFERFYRLDKARSRETGGTGLGLAIVKHIVLAHGGDVWVKSAPGQGATFYFTIPQSEAAAH